MALLFMEGFENYGASLQTQYLGKHSVYSCAGSAGAGGCGSDSVQPGRYTGSAWNPGNQNSSAGSPRIWTRDFGGSNTELFIGFAIFLQDYASQHLFSIVDSIVGATGAFYVAIRMRGSGVITVEDNPLGGTILAWTTRALRRGHWNWVEMRIVLNNTSGAVDFWLDNVAAGSQTGLDTITDSAPAPAGPGYRLLIGRGASFGSAGLYPGNSYLDDLYILDSDGAAPFNTRLGDSHIYKLVPEDDGFANAMGTIFPTTPTTHYDKVEDLGGPNEDASYIEDTGGGQQELFVASDLPTPNPDTVFAVQPVARMRDSTATPGASGSTLLREGGSTSTGAAYATVTGGYENLHDIHTTKPSGGAWDAAGVDGSEIGFTS